MALGVWQVDGLASFLHDYFTPTRFCFTSEAAVDLLLKRALHVAVYHSIRLGQERKSINQ